MTNLSIIVSIWVNIVTNPVPAGVTDNGDNFYEVSSVSSIQQYLPDGAFLNASTVIHHSWITNQEAAIGLRTLKQFSLPPLPPPSFTAASTIPLHLLPPRFANGGPDEENFCRMFRVDFLTETNRIYRLEKSHDLSNWGPCPPEIDGTGQPDRFFDANNAGASYRVVSREGVLGD